MLSRRIGLIFSSHTVGDFLEWVCRFACVLLTFYLLASLLALPGYQAFSIQAQTTVAKLQSRKESRFEIMLSPSLRQEEVTGRLFLIVNQKGDREPRLHGPSPLFGVDVEQWKPKQAITIDDRALGFPYKSLKDLPAGDYFVQALLNVYTEFHRSDAMMQELIPYVEQNFRIIRKPYARMLTGVSTGGWEALALQIFHPDFFGGSWGFSPDPVDFRRYEQVNIYEDENAFFVPGKDDERDIVIQRFSKRSPETDEPLRSVREESLQAAVLGSKNRSGSDFDTWEAVYGPVGDDGYPRPLWDKLTGKIDHSVAQYMKDHGYDLRAYLQSNWATLGPQLVGKLNVICGDMDDYYLNQSVYLLQDFLENTTNPYYAGSFDFGRPMKGHGWQPMPMAELIRTMAKTVAVHSSSGDENQLWNY